MRIASIFFFTLTSILLSCKDDSEVKEDDDKCQLQTPNANISITEDKVIIVLNKVPDADYYSVDYATTFTGSNVIPSATQINDTTFYIQAYYPSTLYKVRIYAGSFSPPYLSNCFNVSGTFPSFETPCGPFNSLRFRNTSATTTSVYWSLFDENDLSDFRFFTLNLRKKGTTDVTFISTENHYANLTELKPNTIYEVQLVYTCSDNEIYPSKWFEFTTSAS